MRPETPLLIQEAFRRPRTTTNPYIVQLAQAIEEHNGMRLRYFSYPRAVLGRYDILHVHWPEQLMGGRTALGRMVRRLLTVAIIARLRVTSTPLVRTWHNLERPAGVGIIDGLLLDQLDKLTTLRITLNEASPAPANAPSVTIRHGDYQQWYAAYPRETFHVGRFVYVGLIRRYKGVERLVEQFRDARTPGLTLQVAGRPSTLEMAAELEALAAADPRVSLTLDFLDDRQFVSAITGSQAVVLPYRHMHNSGTVLAALSLGRPVLVPDNEVNRRLSDEVGPGWVYTYPGDFAAEDLDRLASLLGKGLPDHGPDLSRRSWQSAGEDHFAAFRTALGLSSSASDYPRTVER